MKAIRCREWGAPDVLRLEEAQSPSFKPHQVRIRVRAAGVNFADSLMRLEARALGFFEP
jgi:NADPH2:quinone reductase